MPFFEISIVILEWIDITICILRDLLGIVFEGIPLRTAHGCQKTLQPA